MCQVERTSGWESGLGGSGGGRSSLYCCDSGSLSLSDSLADGRSSVNGSAEAGWISDSEGDTEIIDAEDCWMGEVLVNDIWNLVSVCLDVGLGNKADWAVVANTVHAGIELDFERRPVNGILGSIRNHLVLVFLSLVARLLVIVLAIPARPPALVPPALVSFLFAVILARTWTIVALARLVITWSIVTRLAVVLHLTWIVVTRVIALARVVSTFAAMVRWVLSWIMTTVVRWILSWIAAAIVGRILTGVAAAIVRGRLTWVVASIVRGILTWVLVAVVRRILTLVAVAVMGRMLTWIVAAIVRGLLNWVVFAVVRRILAGIMATVVRRLLTWVAVAVVRRVLAWIVSAVVFTWILFWFPMLVFTRGILSGLVMSRARPILVRRQVVPVVVLWPILLRLGWLAAEIGAVVTAVPSVVVLIVANVVVPAGIHIWNAGGLSHLCSLRAVHTWTRVFTGGDFNLVSRISRDGYRLVQSSDGGDTIVAWNLSRQPSVGGGRIHGFTLLLRNILGVANDILGNARVDRLELLGDRSRFSARLRGDDSVSSWTADIVMIVPFDDCRLPMAHRLPGSSRSCAQQKGRS